MAQVKFIHGDIDNDDVIASCQFLRDQKGLDLLEAAIGQGFFAGHESDARLFITILRSKADEEISGKRGRGRR